MAELISYRIEVDAFDAHTFELEIFDGREALNELYAFNVRVRSELEEDQAMRALGSAAHLWLTRGEETRVIHGVVTALRFEEDRRSSNQRWLVYSLRLEPRARLMALRRNSRIFQGKSIDQVIREVLGLHQVPSRWLLSSPLPRRAYCTQYEETDLAFVMRLAAEAGLHFQFEHAKDEALAASAAVEQLVRAGVDAVSGAVAGASATGVGLTAMEAGAGIFGWLGGLREVMVFADSPVFYPVVPTADGDDWTAQLARLAMQGASMGLGRAEDALNQVDPRLGEAGGAALDAAAGALRAELGLTGRTISYRPTRGALDTTHDDAVIELDKKRQLHSLAAVYRVYDPARPAALLTSQHRDRGELSDVDPARLAARGLEVASQVGSAVGGEVGSALGQVTGTAAQMLGGTSSDRTELYEHQSRFLFPEWEHDRDEPKRVLAAAKRRAAVAVGRGICPWLCAGHRFVLEGHPLPSLSHEQVVVALEHQGTHPSLADATATGRANYIHRLECVAADVHYVPERPPRRFVQVCQTATVVGPTDIDTDELGRIVVRFHWDRRTATDAHTTCRIRTMQGWANGGYGMQFIPRVGSEVVVGFDGGDPDRPIVLGSVYNVASPPPFTLPQRRAVSGIRTQSTPGGTEGSELSFDDTGGRELITLSAQRDLHVTARHERQLTVEGTDRELVREDRHVNVGGALHVDVRGGRELNLRTSDRITVDGDISRDTSGSSHERVEGTQAVDVGQARHTVRGNALLQAAGNVVQRVQGNFVRVVGDGDGGRSYATRVEGDFKLAATEQGALVADKGLVLMCGNSSIHLSPDQIYITAPDILLESASSRLHLGRENAFLTSDGQIVIKGEEVVARGSGAGIGLTSEAAIDGSQVLLNSPTSAQAPAEDRSNEPTIIELTDQRGEPIGNHPFRVIRPDGSEVTGAVDAEGRAEIDLDEDAAIVFPGLRNPRGGS